MERLTKRDKGGNAVVDCDVCEMGESRLANCCVLKCRNRLKDRLAAYEDGEEQGRLVIVPEPTPDIDFMRIFNLIMADADYDRVSRDLRDCRNELCLRCGDYKQRHLGACDGCRWKETDNA